MIDSPRSFTGVAIGVLALIVSACSGSSPGPAETPITIEEEPAGELVERSRSEQVAAERRERERQRLSAEEETEFAYVRYAPELTGDSPRACLWFSQALNPEIDYSVYVDLGTTQPAFDVSGQSLCLDGLRFASSYTATLREGLPGLNGGVLGREEEVSITFEDRPAYVGFRGAGVILPRDNADGLPVETVNVDAVKITVSRVDERALAFKSVTQGRESAQGRYAYLYGEENPSDVAEELWQGTMQIDSVRNAPVVTVFPIQDVIETLEPGAYFVEISDAAAISRRNGPPASARRWIMLTDLALTAFQGGGGMDVTLRSLQDGRVMPNTPVQLIAANNDVLAEVSTGVDGRVTFNAELLAGTGNLAPRLLLARGLKGDTAILDLMRAPIDLSEFATGGRRPAGNLDGYLYTERGIYRPGETVHLTAMVRDRAGRAINDAEGTLITFRPNGVEAQRFRIRTGQAGSLQHDIALPASASRGRWQTRLEIDGVGRVGQVSYAVEDFVPQRIAVELETDDAPILAGDGPRAINVTSRFLYGAPGAGLTVQGQVRLEPDPAPFDTYEAFQWGRHDSWFNERIIELDDAVTDGTGQAVLRLAPGNRGRDADRPLRLNTVVSVLEPGGRAVSESTRIAYRPQDSYIGTRADFDGRLGIGEPARFEIATVSDEGEPVRETVDWRLLAIDYHYDWYRENGSWRWRRSRTVRTVNSGQLTTEDGLAEIAVNGLEWGQHELVVDSQDGLTASRSFYVGWGGDVSNDGVEAPDRVEVVIDEQTIVAGRPAAVTIIPPYDGEAQIVVATDRVLSVESRPVQASGTEITLPVNENWGEGAYIMVNVYTPRDPIVQAKPRRAVGVGYVPVNLDARKFEIDLDAPELARPEQTQTVSVEVSGGPSERIFVTLAAVDEGILRLTKFEDPDPIDWYFGRKALGVTQYDDYGRLLDPNLGLPAEVRSGGDQLGGEGLTVVPTRTVALFSGVVEVGRNNRAEIDFELPPFNGELRLMAVAWSQNGLGAASQPMTVRDEAPADLILPRFMAPGDSAVATVSVDNVELAEGTFEIDLASTEPISVAGPEIESQIPTGQRLDQGMRIEAGDTGIARLRLRVSGPDGYQTARTYPIQSRSPFLPVTVTSKALMEPGQTYAPDTEMLANFVPGTAQVSVSFSGLPIDSNALYQSLSEYPYGCTEQATSRALPLLYSEQLIEPGSGDGVARARVQEAVGKLLNRQNSSGAFGLWREGDNAASPWLGAYTTDFLYRARDAGYEVPRTALERAYSALSGVAEGDAWRVYGYDTDVYESRYHADTEAKMMQRASAYALYVLARAGQADISRLRYLHDRELSQIGSPLARAHIGAGLALMGDRARAISAFNAAEEALGYENSGDYYQTPLRDLSGVLALAAEVGFNDHVERLSEQLTDDTPDPSELTTQEKAFLLVAVDSLSQDEEWRLDVDGLGGGRDSDRSFLLTSDDVENGVSFRLRRGSASAFRTVMVTGAPINAPPATSQSLNVAKAIRTLDGGRVDLGNVTQGDQLVVSILVSPRQRRNNPIIIADLLPAGFEIESVLRPADGAVSDGQGGAFAWLGEIAQAATTEARDDRFVAAVDVVDEAERLAYIVRAVTPGEFTLPGVVAEDMYRPDVYARSAAGRVEISAGGLGPGGSR